MQCPVLATPDAMEGIEGCGKMKHFVSAKKDELVQMAIGLIQAPKQQDSIARDCVLEHYDWHKNLTKVTELLQ